MVGRALWTGLSMAREPMAMRVSPAVSLLSQASGSRHSFSPLRSGPVQQHLQRRSYSSWKSRVKHLAAGGSALASTPIIIEAPAGPLTESTTNPIVAYLADIILASPLPSFGLTIILLTIVLRSGITLPVTFWQRGRMRKMRTVVEPQVREYNRRVAKELVPECRKKGLSFEEYKKLVKAKVADHAAALHKEHGTHPTITMFAPLAIHIPLLIFTSLTIREALQMPGSAMAADSFLWLAKLGEPDNILPFVGAGMTAVNAELMAKRGAKAISEAPDESPPPLSVSGTSTGGSPSPAPIGGRVNAPLTAASSVLAASSTSRAFVPPSSSPSGPSGPSSTSRPATPRAGSSRSQLSRLSPTPPGKPRSPPPILTHQPPKRRLSTSLTPLFAAASSRPPQRGGPEWADVDPKKVSLTPKQQMSIRTSFFSNLIRFSAVMFIPIASQVPSGLALYWVTSIAYSTIQGLVLDFLDRREKLKLVKK